MPLPKSKTYILKIDKEKWDTFQPKFNKDGSTSPANLESNIDEIFNKFPYPSMLREDQRLGYTNSLRARIMNYFSNPYTIYPNDYNLLSTDDALQDKTNIKLKMFIRNLP